MWFSLVSVNMSSWGKYVSVYMVVATNYVPWLTSPPSLAPIPRAAVQPFTKIVDRLARELH